MLGVIEFMGLAVLIALLLTKSIFCTHGDCLKIIKRKPAGSERLHDDIGTAFEDSASGVQILRNDAPVFIPAVECTPICPASEVAVTCSSEIETDDVSPINSIPKLRDASRDEQFWRTSVGIVEIPVASLCYVAEVGCGWFGQVFLGFASGQFGTGTNIASQAVIKQLSSDFTGKQAKVFMKEAQPYASLDHPNILKILGMCTREPMVFQVFEYCSYGDLKCFMLGRLNELDAVRTNDLLLTLACSLSSALLYLHEHGYVYSDIAMHSVLVTEHLELKLGDYGNSESLYPEDYCQIGEEAWPLRWCAPEMATSLSSGVAQYTVTKLANVWSYGVAVMEFLGFPLPLYAELADDKLLSNFVLLTCGKEGAALPTMQAPCGLDCSELLSAILVSCLALEPDQRPPMAAVNSVVMAAARTSRSAICSSPYPSPRRHAGQELMLMAGN